MTAYTRTPPKRRGRVDHGPTPGSDSPTRDGWRYLLRTYLLQLAIFLAGGTMVAGIVATFGGDGDWVEGLFTAAVVATGNWYYTVYLEDPAKRGSFQVRRRRLVSLLGVAAAIGIAWLIKRSF